MEEVVRSVVRVAGRMMSRMRTQQSGSLELALYLSERHHIDVGVGQAPSLPRSLVEQARVHPA